MSPEEINQLNKKIRAYDGDNSFMKSIQKQLTSSKDYFDLNGRKLKRLSDKQYKIAKDYI